MLWLKQSTDAADPRFSRAEESLLSRLMRAAQ